MIGSELLESCEVFGSMGHMCSLPTKLSQHVVSGMKLIPLLINNSSKSEKKAFSARCECYSSKTECLRIDMGSFSSRKVGGN